MYFNNSENSNKQNKIKSLWFTFTVLHVQSYASSLRFTSTVLHVQSLCVFTTVHFYSLTCSIICVFTTVHFYIFIWTIKCAFKFPLWLNCFPHTLQEKGLSPVWIRMWICRAEGLFKILWHTGHSLPAGRGWSGTKGDNWCEQRETICENNGKQLIWTRADNKWKKGNNLYEQGQTISEKKETTYMNKGRQLVKEGNN